MTGAGSVPGKLSVEAVYRAFIWLSSRINAMCLVHNHSHRLAGLTCCQNSFYGSLKERRIWYTPK
ncbi:hypothetical protein BN1723_008379 [Verticillium longisporum]|uniref:Uncharacterized protein n=1 Tax=Verticillium longisporum TaxID=100787 RepID=A0A0G4NRH2_VERLO|nr:hypothetical protein BN1723_008379 [Verticillium longisporum]